MGTEVCLCSQSSEILMWILENRMFGDFYEFTCNSGKL